MVTSVMTVLSRLPLAMDSSATPKPTAATTGQHHRPGAGAPGQLGPAGEHDARRRRRRCRPAAAAPGRSPCGEPDEHGHDDAQRGDRRDDAHRPRGQRGVEGDQADDTRRARRRPPTAGSPSVVAERTGRDGHDQRWPPGRRPARRRPRATAGSRRDRCRRRSRRCPRAGWTAGRGGRPRREARRAESAPRAGRSLPPGARRHRRTLSAMVARREADGGAGGVLAGRSLRCAPPAPRPRSCSRRPRRRSGSPRYAVALTADVARRPRDDREELGDRPVRAAARPRRARGLGRARSGSSRTSGPTSSPRWRPTRCCPASAGPG